MYDPVSPSKISFDSDWTGTTAISRTSSPDGVLVAIFETVLALNNTSSAYKILVTAALVCRSWAKAAQRVLFSYIEVRTGAQATKLVQHQAQNVYIDTLAVGLGASSPRPLKPTSLDNLLLRTPHLRKLVIVLVDHGPHPDYARPLDGLSNLTSLEDVTLILAATTNPLAVETSLIATLPSSVRCLRVPQIQPILPPPHFNPPAFKLRELTVAEYPTPFSNWALSSAEESLEELTVARITDLHRLAKCHPNLKSLNVFGPTDNRDGFRAFGRLESLEFRGLYQAEFMDTLPPSVRRVRVWDGDCVERLAANLKTYGKRKLGLRTVIWDRWLDTFSEKQVQHMECIFSSWGIGLKIIGRTYEGRRPATMAGSSKMPTRILTAPDILIVGLQSLVSGHGMYEAVLESCFQGGAEWVVAEWDRHLRRKEALVKVEAKRRALREWLCPGRGAAVAASTSLIMGISAILFAFTHNIHSGVMLSLYWVAATAILGVMVAGGPARSRPTGRRRWSVLCGLGWAASILWVEMYFAIAVAHGAMFSVSIAGEFFFGAAAVFICVLEAKRYFVPTSLILYDPIHNR